MPRCDREALALHNPERGAGPADDDAQSPAGAPPSTHHSGKFIACRVKRRPEPQGPWGMLAPPRDPRIGYDESARGRPADTAAYVLS